MTEIVEPRRDQGCFTVSRASRSKTYSVDLTGHQFLF